MSDYDPNYIPHKVFTLVGQKAIIKNSHGQFLLLQRSNKSGAGGKWALPGGAIEYNEEPLKAVSREISEETELTVTGLTPFTVRQYLSDEQENVLIIGYTCVAEFEQISLNWEHTNYMWLTPVEALTMELTPDARFFIEKFSKMA
ncbi:MAG: NUDIX domain-containing protein [bacterium]|nr:NUDIX domain-containing protein [bacterium]